jgi:glycine oxidase
VMTSTGKLVADVAVIAAGAWLNAIAIEGAVLPSIRPVRGQIVRLAWQREPLRTIVWGPKCYVVPRTDGTILVGATVEDAGFAEHTTTAGVRDLLEAACELLPSASGAPFIEARVGLRPAAPDDLPVLGPDPELAPIVHACGHYRNGVLLAPVTADLVVAELTGEPVEHAFGPERFDRQGVVA